MDPRLIRLRVELFSAAQTLRGDDLREFWTLIDEVSAIRVLHEPERPRDESRCDEIGEGRA